MKKLCILSVIIVSNFILTAQTPKVFHPEISTIQLVHKSKPLREMKQEPMRTDGKRKIKEKEANGQMPVFKNLPLDQIIKHDAALQKIYSDTTTALNILSNWVGLSTNVDPSDNTITVSPGFVIQMTNNYSDSYMRIWNKAGDLLADHINTSDISGFGDYGDPNIIYDETAERFIFCVLKATGSKLIVCISETNDPMGIWDGYEMTTTGGFPDYPKIAVWGNSYFITTNSNSPTVFAIDRDLLLSGGGLGTTQKFTATGLGTIDFESLAPATVTGLDLPNSPAVMLRVADDAWSGIDNDHLELFLTDINWADPDLSTMTGPIEIPIADYDSYMCGYNSWNCIDQPGPTKLDPLGNIIMDKAQYRKFPGHESIVCSHLVNADGEGTGGMRWYELRKDTADWYIYQQGTFSPDSHHRWMSSVTMNQFGSIALGYNISSTDIYPGIRMTGRMQCDSLGKMTAAEGIAQEGSGSNNYNRYGDYNGIVTDPVDGTFWLTSNYNPNSNWATRVIHFSLDTCTVAETPVDTTHEDTTQTALLDKILISEFNLQPNPADQYLTVSFLSEGSTSFDLIIYDISGKQVFEKNYDVFPGSNAIMIKTGDLANGNYILSVKSSEIFMQKKLAVQHVE